MKQFWKNNKRKILIWLTVLFFASSIIVFLSIFTNETKQNNVSVNDRENSENNIDLANALLQSKNLNEIIDKKNVDNKIVYFFSRDLFKENIVSVINSSLDFIQNKKINFNAFTKKINFFINSNKKELLCDVIFSNKNNSNYFYVSYLKFLII